MQEQWWKLLAVTVIGVSLGACTAAGPDGLMQSDPMDTKELNKRYDAAGECVADAVARRTIAVGQTHARFNNRLITYDGEERVAVYGTPRGGGAGGYVVNIVSSGSGTSTATIYVSQREWPHHEYIANELAKSVDRCID